MTTINFLWNLSIYKCLKVLNWIFDLDKLVLFLILFMYLLQFLLRVVPKKESAAPVPNFFNNFEISSANFRRVVCPFCGYPYCYSLLCFQFCSVYIRKIILQHPPCIFLTLVYFKIYFGIFVVQLKTFPMLLASFA